MARKGKKATRKSTPTKEESDESSYDSGGESHRSVGTSKSVKSKSKTPTKVGTKAKMKKTAKTSKGMSKDEMQDQILNHMAKFHGFGKTVCFYTMSKALGHNKTSKNWLAAWYDLRDEQKMVEGEKKGTKTEYKLSEAGVKKMGIVDKNGYKDSKATSNEEFHQEIKALMDRKFKGAKIFDAFVKHGPMTRKESAKVVGVHDRSHGFSYGFKELKETMNLLEVVSVPGKKGKYFNLSDHAFVADRPPTVPIPVDNFHEETVETPKVVDSEIKKEVADETFSTPIKNEGQFEFASVAPYSLSNRSPEIKTDPDTVVDEIMSNTPIDTKENKSDMEKGVMEEDSEQSFKYESE